MYYYAFEYYFWNKIQNLVKNNLQYLFHWCYFILKAMCDNSIFFILFETQTSSPNSQSHLLSIIYLLCIYLQVERRKNSNNWKLRDKSKKEEFTTGICLTHIYPYVISFNTISKPMRVSIFLWDEKLSLNLYFLSIEILNLLVYQWFWSSWTIVDLEYRDETLLTKNTNGWMND